MKTATIAGLLVLAICGGTQADQMTAMKSGCMGCHQPDKATVGPAIKDIAAKFGSSADVDALVDTVKAGKTADQLTWGKVPMPASPAPRDDVRTVVEWMLTH